MKLEKINTPLCISWEKLNYGIKWKNPETKQKEFKHILHDVFGYARPGNMVALMGATGAGKTTLIDVLANYKTVGEEWGEILINGHPRNKHFPLIAGYVEQFDSHEETMTVRESIEFSAALRLPRSMSVAERRARVQEVIDKLQLGPVAHLIIGNDFIGGISPEYRKKVTIGVELVMDPGILFLDEPTTGLDSASALNVMTCVKVLSKDMSVVCTIHQPSEEVFAVFDTMLLLKRGGKVCYFGAVGDMVPYFLQHGFIPYDGVQNPADYALDCSHRERADISSDKLYLNSTKYQQENEVLVQLRNTDGKMQEPNYDWSERPTWFETLQVLTWRLIRKKYVVQLDHIAWRFAIMAMVSCLLGWAFWDLQITQDGTLSRISILFISLVCVGFIAQIALPEIFERRPHTFRERKANMYSMTALTVALLIVELPILIGESFFAVSFLYYMAGLKGDYLTFVFTWFLSYYSFVCLIDLGCSLTRNPDMAEAACSLLNAFSIVWAGFLVPRDDLGWVWIWFYWMSPIHYAFNACLRNEFNEIGDIPYEEGETIYYESGDDVIDNYHAEELTVLENWLVLLVLCFVTRVLYVIVVLNAEHIKR